MPADPFRYVAYDVDPVAGTLRCRYAVGGHEFEEVVTVDGGDWSRPGVADAARLVFLLAGISYYKAFAPLTIDVGAHPLRDIERRFLRTYHLEGLGEYAYRNDLDLRALEVVGGTPLPDADADASPDAAAAEPAAEPDPDAGAPDPGAGPSTRPLVPFGGGMDSIVTVELLRDLPVEPTLFVVNRPHDRFEAIERPLAATGLPVVRATRALDPTILRSAELGFLNGHVPVTGIISAIAVLTAAVTGRDAVVMSNEWSASVGNVEHHGAVVNHQWSKSIAFERDLRAVLAAFDGAPDYFSMLRPFTELWIARRFAADDQDRYRRTFRSCNRAFHLDPARRLDHWCGRCDKCAFIDLVLSPFVAEADLRDIFDGHEPLADPDLLDLFRPLIGTGGDAKPFECVGDVDECRAAVLLAADRPDRAGSVVLEKLAAELAEVAPAVRRAIPGMLQPTGEHFIPEPYATAAGLG